jgi:hypothetical protein
MSQKEFVLGFAAGAMKLAQGRHDVPKRVEEIADAIRRDDPKMPDATAHRIAWRQYHREQGTKPSTPKQPLTGYKK